MTGGVPTTQKQTKENMSINFNAKVEMEDTLKLHGKQYIHGVDKTMQTDSEKALSEIATMEPTHPMGFVGTVADQVRLLLLLQRHSTAREEAAADLYAINPETIRTKWC